MNQSIVSKNTDKPRSRGGNSIFKNETYNRKYSAAMNTSEVQKGLSMEKCNERIKQSTNNYLGKLASEYQIMKQI